MVFNMDIDGLSLSQIAVIKRLAFNAESQLDSKADFAISQGWDDQTIKTLRDHANECNDLWAKCAKALRGA